MFVYCTLSGESQARILKRALEERGEWKVVVAPLTGADLLAAIEGTRAGDFAVFPEPSLQAELAERRLLRGEALRYELEFYAIAKAPFALADLALPGKRIGSFRPDNPLARMLVDALPEDLRPLVEGNTCHRSDRVDELVRLLRLDALDAAFVWASPPPAADLHVLPVGTSAGCCPLLIAPLQCSRRTDAEVAAIMAVWRGGDVAAALQERPGSRGAGTP